MKKNAHASIMPFRVALVAAVFAAAVSSTFAKTPDYVPTEPEVFANLYNNQWNTNYPLWIPGSWSASLRVYPVAKGADEEQAIFTPAW